MMSSVGEQVPLDLARRRVYMALFTAMAITVHVGEGLLPSPSPWFRFGFANILAVTALVLYGPASAWRLTLTRIGIGSLILGRFLSPGFFLSLGGGIAGLFLMTLGWRAFRPALGPVGVSVLGAAGHAIGQFLVAWAVLLRHDGIWYLFPVYLLFSLLSGIFNGWCASVFLAHLEKRSGRMP